MLNTELTHVRAVIGVLTFAGVLAGCATAPAPTRQAFATLAVRHTPELNQVAKVEIGESIISKEHVSRIRGIAVANTLSETVNAPGVTRIHAGDFTLFANTPDGDFYQGNADYALFGSIVPISERAGVFVPKERSKPAVIYHFANGYHFGVLPVAYTPKEIVSGSSESFRRELVYSGVSQNTATFVYREFKNDLARPAFTQELRYDLSQGREVGYKGARFEIINAGNTAVTYKVLRQLD